jgi:MFS family permease
MRAARSALVALGVLAAAYGGWLLVSRQHGAQVRQVVEWAAAGVILHDAGLAPLALALGWLGDRLLPRRIARVAALAMLLVGTLTIVAIPVLDGAYATGWLLAAGVPVLGLAGGATISLISSTARRRRTPDGSGPGRR